VPLSAARRRNQGQDIRVVLPSTEREANMRSVVLWLLGVPITAIVLLNVFGVI